MKALLERFQRIDSLKMEKIKYFSDLFIQRKTGLEYNVY